MAVQMSIASDEIRRPARVPNPSRSRLAGATVILGQLPTRSRNPKTTRSPNWPEMVAIDVPDRSPIRPRYEEAKMVLQPPEITCRAGIPDQSVGWFG